ncbi:MAG: ABC transporter ATP-binding protein [Candidatus Omnitrophica bacterium CG11_big_fil_rev_8_21_14_0_20_64_10]|nr:MAG: ABC transporter ATP-binding protein [Candidatus Omnitrophica bacterium CG11_big_fil_rev_8_21_14_0_20_64_10]
MIELINLRKRFNGKPVLDQASLTIRDGETMVIIGRSGEGKTVLLRHIIGLIRPDAGQVLVDGQDLAALDKKQLAELRLKFGMLFQGAALFDSLTVEENVAFALLEHARMTPAQIDARVAECLRMVGLAGSQKMKPAELSGGMRKRVGLARAIAMKPKTVLYDEPTTGIDPVMADVINDLIVKLSEQLGVTGIAVTHDMVSAYKIADRIAMLHEGKIIEVGTPDQIRNSSNPLVRNFVEGRADEALLRKGGHPG